MILVALLWVFNFAVSAFNAWAVGKSWLESKAAGGMTHLVTWCEAVMSASGFTWCYTILLAEVAGSVPYKGHILLPAKYVQGTIELGYLVVILPILGSGLGITIASWQNYRRDRTLASGGVAAYDTFAQVYNTYEAVKEIPNVFAHLTSLFSDEDEDSGKVELMIGLVALAVAGGIATTFFIVRVSARAKARDTWYEIQSKRQVPVPATRYR